MTKTITIAGGKGGVGKTNICINAALEIARRNFRTCVLDADFGLASIDTPLGIHPKIAFDDFIYGNKRLDETVLDSSIGIDIVTGKTKIQEISNPTTSFSQLRDYDYFLIDTPSTISREVVSFCLASSETILIITSEPTSLSGAYNLLKVIASNDYKRTVKILVNKCESVPMSRRTYQRFKTVVNKHLNIEIAPAGIVLSDPNIVRAIKQQKPILNLFPNSIGSQCIRTLVSTLLEDDTGENSPTDLGKFWQLYFNFTQSDLSLPDEHPASSTCESSHSSMEHRDTIFHAAGSIQTKQRSFKKAPEAAPPQPERIVPFANNNGIINPLNLPSPTTILIKSLKLQAEGKLSKDEILKFCSCDPALMVRAMHLFCNHKSIDSNRVTKIAQIVERLGTEILSNLIITTSMRKALSEPSTHNNNTFFVNKFWYHSYKSALMAEQIAQIISYPHPEEAFLAGLIHDIGRLALQMDYPSVYQQSPSTFQHSKSLIETETDFFTQTHAEIGAKSLSAWNLNNYIVDAARYHSDSEARVKTGFDLVKIVFLACRMVQSLQEKPKELFRLGHSLLGLTSTQLLACVKTAEQKVKHVADHFDIPPTEMTSKNEINKVNKQLKRQATDYSILQSALPTTTAARDLSQVIRHIHHGLDILFGIKAAICLMVDSSQSTLQAIGYPDCFGWRILSDITLSLNSKKSLVVRSFTTNKLKTSLDLETDSLLSLADEQIIRILDSPGLVCVPMTAFRDTRGIIVFGIQNEEYSNIQKEFSRLETFGSQSAKNISASV